MVLWGCPPLLWAVQSHWNSWHYYLCSYEQMAEAFNVLYLRRWQRSQRAYTQKGGYTGKTGYSILHTLSDLGMYRKSFAANHGKVNFQGKGREGNQENLGWSQPTSSVSTESKSRLSTEAIFQETFPSHTWHIATRWKTSMLQPQTLL